ncbi:integrase [Bifidobacterium sp. UTBIF-68]|uniref:tyrosine-type recombinase/integrase n=1 Tax=Bifidobacterium sp. UTBIF-68 TaxID=1465262 RepID=UPI00112B6988|nr:site-specific integrase [Bifidobacterium sp. UTBIF-68]TPF92497.1 integrase [Bifidobacterium sp. UTBIF-68]
MVDRNGQKTSRRRSFGCIVERKNRDGEVVGLIARYASPVDGRRVYQCFPAHSWRRAEDWLDTERLYVDLHKRGIVEWMSPRERDGKTDTHAVTFASFADGFIRRHRRKDGADLQGSTKRNLRNDVRHLNEVFGDLALTDVTEERIHDWYYGEHPNGEWQFRSECMRLKMILREACSPGAKGAPPLLESNPFTLPIPPEPVAESLDIPPVTPGELYRLYSAMPCYTRLSVYLAACAGGMRIGEVCGLQDTDFDLEHGVLTIQRSVNRGSEDLGPTVTGRLKTTGSRRTVPIPELLRPLIVAHLESRRDPSNHMFFQAKIGDVISQNTIRNQFMRARKAAGREDLQFRTLRVTHATELMLNGGSLKETMDALGHVREQTTLKHYLRVVPEHQRDVSDRTAAYLLSADPSLALASASGPSAAVADGSGDPLSSIVLLLGQVADLLAGHAGGNHGLGEVVRSA